MNKSDNLFKWISYFILFNTFFFILGAYWFIFTHLLFQESSDKIDIITHSSGSKVFRVYKCTCNRLLCYLEEMGLIKSSCRVKSIYTLPIK